MIASCSVVFDGTELGTQLAGRAVACERRGVVFGEAGAVVAARRIHSRNHFLFVKELP
jgi:hypothetical protein